MKKLIPILFVLIAFSSCGEYQKALKSEDVGVKYEAAAKEYDKGKYEKAILLFEQIAHHIEENLRLKSCFICFSPCIKPNSSTSGLSVRNGFFLS
jgi:outer membrane protein assembly factor BamD